MNIIDLLNVRKAKLLEKSGDIRKKLSEIVDESSFVELNAYSFYKNEFFGEDEDGLGVVTGYATVDDYPVYVVAQNGKILNGGLTKGNCEKITACLKKAEKAQLPVIYLMDTQGVQVGEGVGVMEGVASVIATANALKGVIPQFLIAVGDVLGSAAMLAAVADYTYVVGGASIAYTSPAVIAASQKDVIDKSVLFGAKSNNGVKTFAVKSLDEVKDSIIKILGILPGFGGLLVDTDDDLNRSSAKLNDSHTAKEVIDAVYDKNTFVELGAGYVPEVITGIGRVGGVSTAVIAFDGGKDGVELTLENVLKVKNFVNYVAGNNMPVLTLVNVKGIKADVKTNNSAVMVELTNLLYGLSDLDRITLVYGKAIGLGYTAFASKEFGNAYVYAFADAKISLMDGVAGAAVEFGTIDENKLDEVKEKYAESQDAFNAAKIGCVDNIIEPAFARQYVISALEMLIR